MRLLAHRGDWRVAPENSLEAIVRASRLGGLDGAEFDVRRARDGTSVVVHDADLLRLGGIAARVADLTAEELRAHGVASLDEVLRDVTPPAFLDVELKEPPGVDFFATCRRYRGAALADAAISSFDPAILAEVAANELTWPRWFNALDAEPETVDVATRDGCRAVSVLWEAIDGAAVERCRAAGLELVAWTVTDPADLERLERLGVAAACIEGAALDAVASVAQEVQGDQGGEAED